MIKRIFILLFVFSLFVISNFPIAYAQEIPKYFYDVPETHENFYAIHELKDVVFRGDTDVNGDYTYNLRPDDGLNRAEFATIIYRIAPKDEGESSTLGTSDYHDCFPDVSNEWYAGYICWAKEKGYVEGFKGGPLDGKYGPTEPIRVAELLTVLSRIENWEMNANQSVWYENVMGFAGHHNIIRNRQFDSPISRGLTAETVHRNMYLSYQYERDQVDAQLMDFDSLEYFNGILKDKKMIYGHKENFKNSSQPTQMNYVLPENQEFTGINLPFIKTANGIYYLTPTSAELVPEADPNTFEHIEGIFYKDNNQIFDVYSGTTPVATNQFGITPNNFEILVFWNIGNFPLAHIKGNNKIFYSKKNKPYIQIPEADAATFDFLEYQNYPTDPDYFSKNYLFAKDKNHVYYNGEIFSADVNTYERLTSSYGKDKDHVYHDTTIIEYLDAATFELINDNLLFKDKNGVYVNPYYSNLYEDVIDNHAYIDPETFVNIEGQIYRDKDNCFIGTHLLENVDCDSFTHIDLRFYQDKNNIYHGYIIIKGADAATFTIIDDYYSKDKNNVYIQDGIIQEASPETFEVLKHDYAKDHDTVYCGYGKILESADAATFKVLDYLYSKDKNNVYLNDEILPNENPETFTVLY